jgi:4-carboxymuconolactone decarboxylase
MSHEPNLSGADIRRRVLGDAHVQRTTTGGDPFLAPFYELATEHAWGGAWVRPGLELKQRSLVVVSVLIALARAHELRLHLRGALNVGWTPEELREVCLQAAAYAGYPAALEAVRLLAEVVNER